MYRCQPLLQPCLHCATKRFRHQMYGNMFIKWEFSEKNVEINLPAPPPSPLIRDLHNNISFFGVFLYYITFKAETTSNNKYLYVSYNTK